MTERILLDGKYDLTAIADEAEWHLGTLIDLLRERLGVDYRTAERFANFVFDYTAVVRAEEDPWDYLDEDERGRVTVEPAP